MKNVFKILFFSLLLVSFPCFVFAAGLQLVSCTATGNCTATDLLIQAVYAANFLMGIGGSLFLLIFVIGGAMYVVSFFDSSLIQKSKKMMLNAVIGMFLMLSAWIIVSYVSKGLGYVSGGNTGVSTTVKKDTCSEKHKNYSCVETKGTKIKTSDCFAHLCKSKASPTFLCCPPPNPTNNPE